MLRGFTKFRCPDCGHIFEAPDIEDNATIRSIPMPCPRCGAKSNPKKFFWTYTYMDPAPNIIDLIRILIRGKSNK